MELVPLDSVDAVVMALVGLEILTRVSLGAQMDLTLLSTDKEQVGLELVEVEAHTTGEAIKEGLLLVVSEALGLVNDKLKLDDLLSLELVLHERPVSDAAIRRNGVEVEVLDVLISVPAHLPDGVGMLVSAHRGHVDRLVVTLETDIEHHDGTIVETDSEERREERMEVKAHDTRLSGEVILGPRGVLYRVATDETSTLLMELIITITDSEKIAVLGVPLDGSDVLLARLLSRETPQRKHGTVVAGLGVFGVILVVLVIFELDIVGVLNNHALHNLEGTLHGRRVEGILDVLLLNLNGLLILLVLHLLLEDLSLVVLVSLEVGIEDHPLGGLEGEVRAHWRISLNTLMANGQVEGLRRALLEVELVSQRLLLVLVVSLNYIKQCQLI